MYRAVHPTLLSWQYRMPALLRELEALQSDIMCLQEVEHLDDMQHELSRLGCLPACPDGPHARHQLRTPACITQAGESAMLPAPCEVLCIADSSGGIVAIYLSMLSDSAWYWMRLTQ